jgi:dynein light chain LC8-type
MSEKLDAPSSADTGSIAKDGGNGPKAIIKNVDMSDEMQQESVDIASAALEKYNIEKDIAAQIKKEFDRRHGPTWHVVVGKNFGSYVTHGKRSLHPVSRLRVWSRGVYLRTSDRCPRFVNENDSEHCSFSISRNQTLHILLRWIARHPHLEVIDWSLLLELVTMHAWKNSHSMFSFFVSICLSPCIHSEPETWRIFRRH